MSSISIIIPTKNRRNDLVKAVSSVLIQTLQPNELIIVDQTRCESSLKLIENLLILNKNIKLNYIHDEKINGLVNAKKIGLEASRFDYVCFLEDDVILTDDFLQNLYESFNSKNILGCSGIILNHPKKNLIERILFRLFHIGIFKDNRFNYYNNSISVNEIKTDKLSGGITMWRKSIFKEIDFDTKNFFHYYEDIELSSRINNRYPNSLIINTTARLFHNPSPHSRQSDIDIFKNIIVESILYYKKRKAWKNSHFSILILLLGYYIKCILKFDIKYQFTYFKAVKTGIFKNIKI